MSGQYQQPQYHDDAPTVMLGARPAAPTASTAAGDAKAGTARRAVLSGLGVVAAGALGYVAASRLQSGGPADSGAADTAAGTADSAAGSAADSGAGAGAADQPALVKVADIPAGGGTVLADAKVVVCKARDGQVRAFSAICTHQGCTVASVSGGTINCPCHGSKFDATTGKPVAGPAPSPLPTVAVQVRNGAVVRA